MVRKPRPCRPIHPVSRVEVNTRITNGTLVSLVGVLVGVISVSGGALMEQVDYGLRKSENEQLVIRRVT